MKQKTLFILWAGMFVLCAGLGFISEPAGGLRLLMIFLSVLFFLPPATLLRRALKKNDRPTILLIRNLALYSLGATVLILLANFLSLMASEALGNVLYGLLVIVSSPMICSQYWLLSLFLWACLLSASFLNGTQKTVNS